MKLICAEYLISTPDEICGASKKDLGRNKKTQECKDCKCVACFTLLFDVSLGYDGFNL